MSRACPLAAALALSAVLFASHAHAGDPVPKELRAFGYGQIGGATEAFEPLFEGFALDGEGEPRNVFDFSTQVPAFASGIGGRDAFALSFADDERATVRGFNYGNFSFGTITERTFDAGTAFTPNGFEPGEFADPVVPVEEGFTAFANIDFLNDEHMRVGFDVGLAVRTARNGFAEEEASSEVGASFSADLRLSQRLSFTGRAGINVADGARAHLDATANKVTRGAASFIEEETERKDAFVQGGLSFAVAPNFEVDATLGYARELATGEGEMMGRVGAAWKIRF